MTGADQVMTCPNPTGAVCETIIADPPTPAKGSTRAAAQRPGSSVVPNPLERLAQLVIANDRLMDDLGTSRSSIDAARAYLDTPGCNARFGSTHLDRCRARHSGILSQLRANRIEALGLLGD